MELIVASGIGALAGSGVWLLLRPRTFQVIIGLSLLSYAVNLFIVAMGRLRSKPSSSAVVSIATGMSLINSSILLSCCCRYTDRSTCIPSLWVPISSASYAAIPD